MQEPGGLSTLNQEAMRYLLRKIDEGSGADTPPAFATSERKLPFEDIEGLIFGMMHMQRWREPWRQGLLDQAKRLAVIFPGRLELHERAKKPDGLTFIARADVGFVS